MLCPVIVPWDKVKELKSFDSLDGQVLQLFLSPGKLISGYSCFISLPPMIEPTSKSPTNSKEKPINSFLKLLCQLPVIPASGLVFVVCFCDLLFGGCGRREGAGPCHL